MQSTVLSKHKCKCDYMLLPGREHCQGDVVFVLDSSASVGALNWSVTLQFVIDVMKGLKISSSGTHVSVVIYSMVVETCFGLTKYFSMDDIEPVVISLAYMAGPSNAADAIKTMHQLFTQHSRDAKKVGVVITDGQFNVNEARTFPEAELAQTDGIEMFIIGT